MPDRTQVADLSGPQALQPTAAPVDAYHSPVVARPRPQDAQLGDIAAALQDIQPSLARFNQTSMQMSMEEGHALAAKNKLQFKDAVDKGIISPGQNPWLAKGYKEQILSLQAQDYDSNLRQAWTKSGVSESDDPAAFKKFTDSFTQSYVDKMDLKNDPTFGQTFVPQMLHSQENLLQQHTEYRQQRIVEQAKDATYRNVQGLIDSHYLFADDAHLQDTIKQTVDGMVQNGLPGSDANRLMTDAIRDKAIKDGDPTILSLGRGINTGNGQLGKTQYAQEQFRDAEQHIFTLQREKDAYEWTNRERNLKLIGEDLLKQGYSRIGEDPTSDISDILKQAETVDPEKAKTLREYKDYVLTQNHKVYEDPVVTGQLYDHIYQGTATPGEILGLANEHKLAPDQVSYAFRDMEQAAHHREILDDPNVNRVVEELGSSISGGELIATPESKGRAIDAKNLLRQSIIDYRTTHPNSSKMEVYEQAVKNQTTIRKALPGGETAGNLPANLPSKVAPTAAAPAPAAAPVSKPLYSTPDDLKKAIAEYNSTQGQGRLAIQAEALGIPVEDLIKAQRAHFVKKPAK